MKNNLKSLYTGALIALYQVSWVWYLTKVIGDSAYSIGMVSTGLLIGFISGRHVYGALFKKFKTPYLSAYLQASTGIGAAFLFLIISRYDAVYSSPLAAVITISTILLLHDTLLGASIFSSGSQFSSEELVKGAALGSILTGFILIPLFDINTVYIASVLSLSGAFFYEEKRTKVKKGILSFKALYAVDGFGVALFLVFWSQYTGSIVGVSKAYSLELYSILLGWMLKRTLDFRISQVLKKIWLVHAAISGVLAYIVLVNISGVAGTLSLPLFSAVLTIPFWIVSSELFEKEPASFAIGMTAGLLLSIILAGSIGGINLLLALILIGVVRLKTGASGTIWEKNSMVSLGVILVLGLHIATTPVQSIPKADVSPMAQRFSTHIPAVMIRGGSGTVSESLPLLGTSVDVLILKGVEREKGFYLLAESRLRENGFLVQKINLLNTSDAVFRNIVRSTQDVFPHTSLWLVDKNGLLISASKPTNLDYIQMKERILGNEDIRGDIEELFPATDFTDITIVDSFSLLYFMSERELFDYTHDIKERDNAFFSIFDFKKRYSNSTLAISQPPIVNGIIREGEEVSIEFLRLRTRIGLRWMDETGFLARYGLVGDTTDYGISFDKGAVFINGSTTVIFQSFQSRTATNLDLTDPVLLILDEEVRQLGLNLLIDRGYELQEAASERAGRYLKHLFYGGIEGHDAKAIVMVWYCESNKAINLVIIDFIHEDPEFETILESVACT